MHGSGIVLWLNLPSNTSLLRAICHKAVITGKTTVLDMSTHLETASRIYNILFAFTIRRLGRSVRDGAVTGLVWS